MAGLFSFGALRVFVTAANNLNFSRAAAELGMTQPHVSAQVSALEGRLGVELFDRSPARGVRLTAAGQSLLRHAVNVITELEAAQEELSAIGGELEGRIKVAASTTPGGYVLPGALTVFSQSHACVQVSLAIGSALSVEQAVLAGDADLGVLAGPVASSRLRAIVLDSTESALVVPAQHAWARRDVIKPSELAQVTMLSREKGSSTRGQLDREMRRVGISTKAAWEFNDIDAIKHAVVAGLGVAVLSTRAVRWEVAAGLLATVGIEGLDLDQDITAIVSDSKPLGAAASAFLSLLCRDQVINP